MGLERTVTCPNGVPGWDAIKALLGRVGERGQIRMIDNLPAFPDETPEPGWRELRVAAGGAMVTIRAQGDVLTCVVWSNADPELLAARDRIAWACAEAAGGLVHAEAGTVPAAEFAQLSGIRPA
jgi:hypothetical protein